MMTRQQESTIELLAIQFGRVMVSSTKFADGAVEVTAEDGTNLKLRPNGQVQTSSIRFGIDWCDK